MAPQSSARALKKPLRLDDEVRFLRSWIEKPLHVGAVMPSGKVLARTVARYVDIQSSAPVIELGPGTGAITDALIARGVHEKRLLLVEFDPGFCALLRERYPQATVIQGDAYNLDQTLSELRRAGSRDGVRSAARHQADDGPHEADAGRLLEAGARRALYSVYLFGGATDSEVAAGRSHAGL